MCGRFNRVPDTDTTAIDAHPLGALLKPALQGPPRYNIAPTQPVSILIQAPDGPELRDARWGLIPSWWRQSSAPTHTTNARSETAASKPMWRGPWRQQRCLIPATGWYEWYNLETGKGRPKKIPHHLQTRDRSAFVFGGLWSEYTPPDAHPITSFTIVTYASPPDVAVIHERTPVVLRPEAWERWLDPTLRDPDQVMELMRASAVREFQRTPIGTAVSKAGQDGPELLEPVDWPELREQGEVVVSDDVLHWLRTASVDQLESRLQWEKGSMNPATLRLWMRELADRDIQVLMSRLRQVLQSGKRPD